MPALACPRRPRALRSTAGTSLALCAAFLLLAHTTQPVIAARAADPDYEGLYARGISFAEFLESARARRDEWRQHYNDARVTPDLVTRMRALPEHRRLLVVAEDWCSDSVNTIPYIARLVDGAPERLALRIVNSTTGRLAMEANLTPDGRAATPTIVLLGDAGGAVGAWVERPAPAQTWFLEQQKTLLQQPLHAQLMKWYADDGGRTTVAEIAALLER
jgi:thioredoxin family protein